MVKSADVIARLRVAGAIARDVLVDTGAAVAPGVTTDEIDRVSHAAHVARSVYPSPLGYKGFPKSVCTSVNEVICHGIPDDRPQRTATSSMSTSPSTSTVCTATRARRSALVASIRCPSAWCASSGFELAIGAVCPGAPRHRPGDREPRRRLQRGAVVVGHGIGARPAAGSHYFEPAAAIMEPGWFTIEPMITIGDIRQ
jgi:methionyl aminopeptidase